MAETIERPWHARAVELFEAEGTWSDYAAWQEWFDRQEALVGRDRDSSVRERLTGVEGVSLYCVFCNLWDAAVKGTANG